MMSPEQAAFLAKKLADGMTGNGANITSAECAVIMAIQQDMGQLDNEVQQFKQIATMAVSKLGGYLEVTEKEVTEFKGGLIFTQSKDKKSRIVGFMPSEENNYVGLEDVLIEIEDLDSLEWVVIAKSPTGAVVAHCDDSFKVLSQADIDSDYTVTINPNRVTIEEAVRRQKEEQSGLKILRP